MSIAIGSRRGAAPALILAVSVSVLATSCGAMNEAPPPTTPPPPTTTTPAPPDAGAAVAASVRNLPVAAAAFNTPEHLARNETATIRLLLRPGKTVSVAELEGRIKEAGDKSGVYVAYSNLMAAKLASEDFDVTPITSEQQVVVSGRDTSWLWQIKPKRTGTLHLYLTLNAFVDVAGQSSPYQVTTFSRTLTIEVPFATRLGDFVKGNWQWLWTVLVPIAVGLYKWGFKRRHTPTPPRAGAATPDSP